MFNKIGVNLVLNLEVEPIIKIDFNQNSDKLSFVCDILTKLLDEN